MARVNVQTEGLSAEELTVVKATWDDLETPLAPLPAPEASHYDAAVVTTSADSPGCTLQSATCPACIQRRAHKRVTQAHSQRWGECSFALRPPALAAAILPAEAVQEEPQEDLTPEERPTRQLSTTEEGVEILGLAPSPSSIFGPAAARTQAAAGCPGDP